MGIKGLTKLLSDNAPKSMKENKFESYFGRKIAVDASMSIYQFLIVVGRSGTEMLTNEAGEVTSHLQGMLSRTIRLLEAGMKPVYVFDGKPPDLKKQELAKRYSKRAEATEDLSEALESANKEDIEKFSKRTVKVTKKHNEDCKTLLRLMGVPVVEVYAVASEDMDSLTFGAPKFLRHLMDPSSKKFQSWNLKLQRYTIPDNWPYQEARQLFKEPMVLTDEKELDIKWTAPDEEGLITFLVNENGFNSDRVTKSIEKIKAAKNKSSQGRLESFFKPTANPSVPIKRKEIKCMLRSFKPAIEHKMFCLQTCNWSRPMVYGNLSLPMYSLGSELHTLV
ncbi:hypothetical protein ACSQ67_015279 [Phaseolus vulgaris]